MNERPVSVTSLECCYLLLTNHVTSIIRTLQHELTFSCRVHRLWQHHNSGDVQKQTLMRLFSGFVSGLNRHFDLLSFDVASSGVSRRFERAFFFNPQGLPSFPTSPSIIKATLSFETSVVTHCGNVVACRRRNRRYPSVIYQTVDA